MTYRILLWLSITFTSVCGPLSAYTIDTGLIKFVQPNGVEFVGREWSEGYVVTRETEDGFKFLQDNDRYYYYAELDQRGDFSPTQLKVGIDDPVRNNLSKNLDRSADRKAEINDALTRSRNPFAAGVAGKATAAQTAPPLDITIGIILVEFADVKGSSYTESDFEDMFFGPSYDNTDHPDGQTVYGSIAAYWDQVSNGDLTITDAAVSGGPTGGILNPVFSGAPSWVPLAGNKADYHLNERMWEFRTAAKNAADNMLGGDIDADSDNTFRIAIVYAGNLYDPQWTACGSNCGLTPHAILNGHEYVHSELRDSNHNTDERNCDDGTTSPGDCTYNTIDFAHIGSHVHEIGHTLGLEHPHEGKSTASDVYFWSPIQSGDKGGGNIGSSPIVLTPEEMVDLGFASFTTISGRRDGLTVEAGDYYKVDYGGSGDHFIFEHRESGGSFNNYLWKDSWTGSGLLLWYTDHDTGDSDTENQSLIAADGDPDHHEDMAADVFPGPGNVDDINDDTDPEPNGGTGISSSATTLFALTNIDGSSSSETVVDVFDNHYSDTPDVTVLEKAEARKQKMHLEWDSTPYSSKYYVYWGTTHHIYDQLETVSNPQLVKLISSLTNGTQYYFKVNSSEEFTNIPSACRSDFDDDDDIDLDDFFDFADAFGLEEGESGYAQKFDLQGNKEVDYPDTVYFYADIGEDCGDIPKAMAAGDMITSGKNQDAVYDLTVEKRGNQFVADINVGNLSELSGFGVLLDYDLTELSFNGAAGVGKLFTTRAGEAAILAVSKMTEPGSVIAAAALKRGHNSVDGSGEFASFFFDTVGEVQGVPDVTIRGLVLADSDRGVDWIISDTPAVESSHSDQMAMTAAPNPGNPNTVIQFKLPEAMDVELEIFDSIGQKVRTLLPTGLRSAGTHSIGWDALDDRGQAVGSGVYIVQLKGEYATLLTHKISMVK